MTLRPKLAYGLLAGTLIGVSVLYFGARLTRAHADDVTTGIQSDDLVPPELDAPPQAEPQAEVETPAEPPKAEPPKPEPAKKAEAPKIEPKKVEAARVVEPAAPLPAVDPALITPTEPPKAVAAPLPRKAPTRKLASDEHPANKSEETYNPFIPRYQQTHPQWAVTAAGSLRALGNQPVFPGQVNQTVTGVTFQGEFQPKFIQKHGLGVVGFGPSLSIYPVNNLTKNAVSIYSYGGQFHYEARFFREQWIVPTVGYNVEVLNYNLNGGTEGRIYISGISYGAMLNLNIIDPSAASDFYANYQVSRSYLVAEFRQLTGSDSNINLTGSSLYFGVRIEF